MDAPLQFQGLVHWEYMKFSGACIDKITKVDRPPSPLAARVGSNFARTCDFKLFLPSPFIMSASAFAWERE